MPTLNNIPVNLWDVETKRNRTVRDIAGRMVHFFVGRVPANLCSVFRRLFDEGYCDIEEFKCTYQGTVQVLQPFGGPELLCKYHLSVPENNFRDAMRIFEAILPRTDLERISC